VLIPLQGQQVISPIFHDDPLGGLNLCVSCIGGDHHSIQRPHLFKAMAAGFLAPAKVAQVAQAKDCDFPPCQPDF